jgi:hypothetical protein
VALIPQALPLIFWLVKVAVFVSLQAKPAGAVATVAATANFLAVRIMIGFLLLEMGSAHQVVPLRKN